MSILDTSLNTLFAGQPDLGHPALAVLLLDHFIVQVQVLHVHGRVADQAQPDLGHPTLAVLLLDPTYPLLHLPLPEAGSLFTALFVCQLLPGRHADSFIQPLSRQLSRRLSQHDFLNMNTALHLQYEHLRCRI